MLLRPRCDSIPSVRQSHFVGEFLRISLWPARQRAAASKRALRMDKRVEAPNLVLAQIAGEPERSRNCRRGAGRLAPYAARRIVACKHAGHGTGAGNFGHLAATGLGNE